MLILDICRQMWYRRFNMDETTNTSQTPSSQEREAEAARRLMRGQRIGALIAAGAVVTTSFGVMQAVSNENARTDRVTTITEEYQNDQDILKEIKEDALSVVDPASIVGMFVINEGNTIDQIGHEIAQSQPEYQNADEATQNWIDYTIQESGVAQGSYDVGDNFVVSRVEIGGKETLIVQDGTLSADHLQLPMPPALDDGAIPAPNTH